jgi:hypothetical protein
LGELRVRGMTYIADATGGWVVGEGNVVLRSACFADGEVAELEGHLVSLNLCVVLL